MKQIYVALELDGSEKPVIEEAISFCKSLVGELTALHVNDVHAGKMSMMMDAPKKIEESDVRSHFEELGFSSIANTMKVHILTSESVAMAISDATKNADLLVLGHKRMSTFTANLFDSVDEGIVNHASCPVLVVQK